ncbi:hypothetical protein [Alteromonas sp. KUL49]|uniref:hypothetical protein n=1 Tax=Alteromonas sp. KUL49 TaxID=2480798 RepID=UPI00102EDA92|nr:hypothetical protein [Alteromonas sp. KUL49]TAP39704.1 hypothetical protein EYS00_10260 [Alteromonas sp. KUL49]GEA11694.1 hypothetical protein KUL49_20690 [Alteromonas sp. KUL49]
MRISVFLLVIVWSNFSSSNELSSVLDTFVHAKCNSETVDIVLVLTNNTPYELKILANHQINDRYLYPDIFSIYDAKRLTDYIVNEGKASGVLLVGDFRSSVDIEPKEFFIKPFEKNTGHTKD